MKKSNRSRKQFIIAQGATCNNWNWSWSFVNHEKKEVIFGAWDIHLHSGKCMVLGNSWKIKADGKKASGYPQSLEHIRLIEEQGYLLKIFPIIYSDANKNSSGEGPAKIDGFIEDIQVKKLQKFPDGWYACDNDVETIISEEIEFAEKYIEGATQSVNVNAYERSSKARNACIRHHGYNCHICNFDFEKVYGKLGKEYIHVHHIVPLHEIKKEYELDPIKDLIPLCPNCHSMIHRTTPALKVEVLKQVLTNS